MYKHWFSLQEKKRKAFFELFVVGLSLSMGDIYFYLSLLSPLKAFNDQPSKKMIACGEKNTLRSEHSSNTPLANL